MSGKVVLEAQIWLKLIRMYIGSQRNGHSFKTKTTLEMMKNASNRFHKFVRTDAKYTQHQTNWFNLTPFKKVQRKKS